MTSGRFGRLAIAFIAAAVGILSLAAARSDPVGSFGLAFGAALGTAGGDCRACAGAAGAEDAAVPAEMAPLSG